MGNLKKYMKIGVVLLIPLSIEYILLKIFLLNAPYVNNSIIFASTCLGVSFAIAFIYFSTYGHLLHEFGHYFVANQYSKTSAKIDYVFYPFKERIQISKISFGKEQRSKITGNMHPDNNFQPYTLQEICKIAKAGYQWAIAGSMVYLIAHIPILLHVFVDNGINITTAKELITWVVLIYSLFVLCMYITYRFFNPKIVWSDWDIWHDPAGFQQYYKKLGGK